MTTKEKTLTNSHGIDTPFKVLQTDNIDDSLFLRKKSIDIDIKGIASNKDWQHFIQRLALTLVKESGVGIAASQVGIGRNLFLFTRIDRPEKAVQIAINPHIVNHSDEIICFKGDGCLSVPDLSGSTKRYAWIDVEYYNEKGEFIKERLSGQSRDSDFTGVIFQHEFDHLQGILFTDRLFDGAESLQRGR
jgi:peptide deformylase